VNLQVDEIRAVLFDFDGTLAETNINFGEMRRRINSLVQQWGVWETGMDEGRYVLEVIDLAAARLASGSAVSRKGTEGEHHSGGGGEGAAPAGDEAEFREQAKQVLIDVEMETCALAKPYPGVPEALDALVAADLYTGIITRNCRACVDHFLQRHPLAHQVLLTRDDVTLVKPDPHHLLVALQTLQVSPAASLMVGDHRSDIECALAAGARGIGVHLTGTGPEQFVDLGAIASFADVPTFVAALLRGGR
jgi:phosphoglycolate phosphatase